MNEASPWAPLKTPLYRSLWIASLASNIGTWMQDVGAGWMMTSLSSDPLMVALVQGAASLPMFLFGLPSGVLADIVDRRRYLIVAQCWMLVAAAALGALAVGGLVTPSLLLTATFLLGVGGAMAAPPFQAIMPTLVPKAELPAAVALNSLGVNASRAIGPALAGLILSFTGPAAVFFVNALSVLGVLAVLVAWHPPPQLRRLPPESFLPAVRAGLRYVRSAPLLRTVLIRAVAFFMFGSAAWSLLPLIARGPLGLDAGGYGLLLACMGAGAVAGALLLPRLRKRVPIDVLATGATLLFALTMVALATLTSAPLVGVALVFAGSAWIAMLSLLNMGAQRSSAGWVKARALSVYLVVFFGSMAGGSVIWGRAAALWGTPTVLLIAAAGMALATATALRWRLGAWPELDLSPMQLAFAEPILQPQADQGPVMVDIEYQVDAAEAGAFCAVIDEMRDVRRRGGALSWAVYQDMAAPERYHEVWVIVSWLDHQREHERFTANDRAIQARVHAFHRGPQAPKITHLIAPERK